MVYMEYKLPKIRPLYSEYMFGGGGVGGGGGGGDGSNSEKEGSAVPSTFQKFPAYFFPMKYSVAGADTGFRKGEVRVTVKY